MGILVKSTQFYQQYQFYRTGLVNLTVCCRPGGGFSSVAEYPTVTPVAAAACQLSGPHCYWHVTKFGCTNGHVFVASVVVVVCVPGSLLEPPFAQVDDAMSPPADLFAPTSYAILKLYVHYEVLEKNSLWIRGEVSIDYSNASLTS